MRLPLPEPSALRRAALSMHALDDVDRDWILAALPSAERDRLSPLLGELRELGIPAQAVPPATWVDAQAGTMDSLSALQEEDVIRLAELLRGEPPVIVETLLAAQPWPWRGRVLALLDHPAREPASRAGGDALPSALQAAVLHALSQRMQAPAAKAPATPRRGGWRAMFIRLRRRAGNSP